MEGEAGDERAVERQRLRQGREEMGRAERRCVDVLQGARECSN
ncbi:MAG: hypothetical protein R3A79_30630 [Nannocystaceae bacterium]